MSTTKLLLNYNLNYFLEKFKEFYKDKYGEDEHQEMVEENTNKEEDNLEETAPVVTTNDEFRSFTFTLGKVLNEGVDYNRFLDILNRNQKIATDFVLGVQHLLSIVTDMVLSGEMNTILNAEDQQKKYTVFFLKPM